MRITHHFADGTTRESTAGVRVPYTAATASAYATVQRVADRIDAGSTGAGPSVLLPAKGQAGPGTGPVQQKGA